jgi:hypothetical protein
MTQRITRSQTITAIDAKVASEYEDSRKGATNSPRLLKAPSKKPKRNVEDYNDPFKTPSKGRRRTRGVEPTPHSKADLRKQRNFKFMVTPPQLCRACPLIHM